MAHDQKVEVSGVVEDALGRGNYRVLLDQSETPVRGRVCGKMRRHRIRVVIGDRVRMELSPYDLSHGFIVFRERYAGQPGPSRRR